MLKEEQKKDWSEGKYDVLRTYRVNNDEVMLAASYLRDAILLTRSSSVSEYVDQYYTAHLDGDSTISHLSRRILKYRLVKSLVHGCVLCLILLSFIEPPSWCSNFNDGDETGANYCDLVLKKKGIPSFYSNNSEPEIQDYYPNTGTNILNTNQSFMMEKFLVWVIAVYLIMKFSSYNFSMRKYFAMDAYSTTSMTSYALTVKNLKMSSFVRIVQSSSIVLLIIGLRSTYRPWSIFLRIIVFITFSETAQEQTLIAAKLVPTLLSVSTVLFMVIFFYGMIGVFIFNDTVEGSEFFPNLLEAMWTLWTTMQSVIYPVSYFIQ